MNEPGGGPLSGVRILDLTMNLSGPFATMVLAQQGADVVKVERPPVGDILRKVGSGRGGASAYFVNTNWGKRSIALDFDAEADRATLRKLIATADVMVENFRPDGDAQARFPRRGARRRAPGADLRRAARVPLATRRSPTHPRTTT